MKLRVAAFVLFVTTLATQAFADPAYDLWSQGKYEEAIKTGLAENNAGGLAIAARAAASAARSAPRAAVPFIGRVRSSGGAQSKNSSGLALSTAPVPKST